MPCFSPLSAYRLANGSIVFAERGDVVSALSLPCGQCIGCRLERSRQWAVRCMHESSMHDSNCFITLTYDDDHLPYDRSLNYRHFQLFMKKLRKRFTGVPIRFYMCGEYGEKFDRPHYHAIIFGLDFADRDVVSVSDSGFPVSFSKVLSSLWSFGNAYVGDVSFESAAYCARYIMKKITGDMAIEHYKFITPDGEVLYRTPEFNHMSNRKGIGFSWIDKFLSDVFPHDRVVINGSKSKPPRYYDKIYSKINPDSFEAIQFQREQDGRSRYSDNTPDRLAVREVCTRARLSRFSRSID
nr:MAG: replication initiator protein [Microviridae sp.]